MLFLWNCFRKEDYMKKMNILFAVFCVLALSASFSIAADDQPEARRGIRVNVQYDPLGPNNLIVAYVKFINENQYRVEGNWWPVITCEDGNRRQGLVAALNLNQGETLAVNIMRSAACGPGRVKDIYVEMNVNKAGP